MRKADIVGGLLFLSFALVMIFVVIPMENSGGVWHGLSPYFYPMVMLVGIAIASVGLVLQAWRKPELYRDEPNPLTRERLGFFLLISAIVLAGVLLTGKFGIWVGGPALIAGCMLFMGERKLDLIVPVSLVPVVIAYLLITHVLRSPLP
ncbi:MAG: tripartite tricarboxylate transporter TctB family protein [Gammaproteobacteria bacterium]|nr:tripartite tricarboxylate transporter TctB family protein [Gammaproteobacteria bacterium]